MLAHLGPLLAYLGLMLAILSQLGPYVGHLGPTFWVFLLHVFFNRFLLISRVP